jgi:hypothetical protein
MLRTLRAAYAILSHCVRLTDRHRLGWLSVVVSEADDVVHFHYGLAVADRLLSIPPRGDAVTDPTLPHTANSADGTFTRLNTAFTGARLSPIGCLSIRT